MMRLVLIVLGFLSLFFFPWPFTLVLAFLAAFYVPPLGLLFGVLSDVLYFASGASFYPLGTLLGIVGFLLALVVHDFVKTRIMNA